MRALWRRERPLVRTGGCRLSRLIARRRLAYALASAAAAGAIACAVSSAAAPLGPSTSLLVWSDWDISAMSPTGKAEKPLTTGKCVASGVQWAPDRSRVYVGCLFEKPGRSVVAYDGPAAPAAPPDIHDLRVVLPNAGAFAIAPDGRIAFEWDGRILVANADGSRQRRISNTVFHHEIVTLGWSADSSHVFVDNCAKFNGPTCARADLMSIPVSGGPARVLLGVRNVFHLLPAGSSRQSKKIAFSVCRGRAWGCKLAIANADGTGYRDLTDWKDGKVYWPCWSPDGSRIAFVGSGFAGDGKTKQDTPIHIITPTGKPVATIPMKQVTDIDW